jgi:hypothetical protein
VQSFPIADQDLFDSQGLMEELTDQQAFGTRGEAWFIAQVRRRTCQPPLQQQQPGASPS